jgi:hypothetical protein
LAAEIWGIVTRIDNLMDVMFAERGLDVADRKIGNALEASTDLFRKAWQRFSAMVDAEKKCRGMSGEIDTPKGKVQFKTFALAGRVMITLERGDEDVSFVAEEGHPERLGLHTVHGTVVGVAEMVEAVSQWDGKLHPDKGLRIV